MVAAVLATLLGLRFGQTLKSPFTRRSSTIGFFLSTPRSSLKTAEMPPELLSFTRPVEVTRARVPLVTSTVAPNGIVPVVNGAPFTSTVPVAVPVGGVAAPPEPVVVGRTAAPAAGSSSAIGADRGHLDRVAGDQNGDAHVIGCRRDAGVADADRLALRQHRAGPPRLPVVGNSMDQVQSVGVTTGEDGMEPPARVLEGVQARRADPAAAVDGDRRPEGRSVPLAGEERVVRRARQQEEPARAAGELRIGGHAEIDRRASSLRRH